jgi:hypothetical protein
MSKQKIKLNQFLCDICHIKKNSILWGFTQYSPLNIYYSSKISVNFYQTTQSHDPEYSNLHRHHHAKLKCLKHSRVLKFISSFSIACSEEKGQILKEYYRR